MAHEGLVRAVTDMVSNKALQKKVARSPAALERYKLNKSETVMIQRVAKEGLDDMFEGRGGKAAHRLAAHMGKSRGRVSDDLQAALNNAVFKRYLDPLRMSLVGPAL